MARRILVCDDEPFILKALTFIVRKEGHTVLEARNGEEAVAKIRAEKPDLVFLDLMMPKKNGYEVCRTIKHDWGLADTTVILLTAKGQVDDRQAGLAAGADDYVTKPFDPDDLLARARTALHLDGGVA